LLCRRLLPLGVLWKLLTDGGESIRLVRSEAGAEKLAGLPLAPLCAGALRLERSAQKAAPKERYHVAIDSVGGLTRRPVSDLLLKGRDGRSISAR